MKKINKHGRGSKRGEPHVRLHKYELETLAYRTLSTDARALLVEFRALYTGKQNRVFLSVREMVSRLGIGQRRAQHARDELITRGWIRIFELGTFNRKTKAATVYVLTNEPLEERDGATAPKDFMRWKPEEKNTVATTTTHSSRHDYRDNINQTRNDPNGSHRDYRKPEIWPATVVTTTTQIELPREHSEPDFFIWAAMTTGIDESVQRALLVAWLLVNQEPLQAAA